jgi:hypothetical protein
MAFKYSHGAPSKIHSNATNRSKSGPGSGPPGIQDKGGAGTFKRPMGKIPASATKSAKPSKGA